LIYRKFGRYALHFSYAASKFCLQVFARKSQGKAWQYSASTQHSAIGEKLLKQAKPSFVLLVIYKAGCKELPWWQAFGGVGAT
jgi:hypothetical protein